MRAIIVEKHGGPEVLSAVDVPAPQAGPGQLLAAVEAAGVNFFDVYQREGRYPVPPPFALGREGAGTVLALGDGVTGFAVGDRIAWSYAPGSYAEQVAVDASVAVKVPPAISTDQAAAVILQGMTAHYLTRSSFPVKPGDSMLVHAAAGGMGLLLCQLGTMLGAKVIGTVSTAGKEQLARAAGAAEVIRYDGLSTDELTTAVKAANGGEGVHVVYDGVGKATFDASLASLRRRGTLVLYGAASGAVAPFDPMRLFTGGSLTLTRPNLDDFIATQAELNQRAGEVFAWIADGTLDLRIGARHPLTEAAQAHRDLEGRATTGKVLLINEGPA